MLATLGAQRVKPMGNIYLYARRERDPLLAFTLAMGHDIPEDQRFIDNAGMTAQLEELKDTIEPGDTILVGTITDFMTPDISDMLNALEDFADDNITIRSLLEQTTT